MILDRSVGTDTTCRPELHGTEESWGRNRWFKQSAGLRFGHRLNATGKLGDRGKPLLLCDHEIKMQCRGLAGVGMIATAAVNGVDEAVQKPCPRRGCRRILAAAARTATACVVRPRFRRATALVHRRALRQRRMRLNKKRRWRHRRQPLHRQQRHHLHRDNQTTPAHKVHCMRPLDKLKDKLVARQFESGKKEGRRTRLRHPFSLPRNHIETAPIRRTVVVRELHPRPVMVAPLFNGAFGLSGQ